MADKNTINLLFEPTTTQVSRVLNQNFLSDLDQHLLLKVALVASVTFAAIYCAYCATQKLSAQLENPLENVFEIFNEKGCCFPPGWDGEEYLNNEYHRELAKKADPSRERTHLYCQEYIDERGFRLPPGWNGKKYLTSPIDRRMAIKADPELQRPWLYSKLFHEAHLIGLPMDYRGTQINMDKVKEMVQCTLQEDTNFSGPEQVEIDEDGHRKELPEQMQIPHTQISKREGG